MYTIVAALLASFSKDIVRILLPITAKHQMYCKCFAVGLRNCAQGLYIEKFSKISLANHI